MTNQPPLHGPSDRVLRLLLLRENARRQRGLWGLPQEHTSGAAWQPQLSTGILGALVPSCPHGVGVLSFGVDSAMRQRQLNGCSRSTARKTIQLEVLHIDRDTPAYPCGVWL